MGPGADGGGGRTSHDMAIFDTTPGFMSGSADGGPSAGGGYPGAGGGGYGASAGGGMQMPPWMQQGPHMGMGGGGGMQMPPWMQPPWMQGGGGAGGGGPWGQPPQDPRRSQDYTAGRYRGAFGYAPPQGTLRIGPGGQTYMDRGPAPPTLSSGGGGGTQTPPYVPQTGGVYTKPGTQTPPYIPPGKPQQPPRGPDTLANSSNQTPPIRPISTGFRR